MHLLYCACVLLCIYACLIDQCSLQASQGNILGAAHVYSAPEKRLLSALVTLHVLIHTWIQFRIGADRHTCTHAHKEPLLNSHTHTPTPSLEWPCRRACLCQQMSGRRCVFRCLSLRSFHLLLQRLPICLWPCFISAHSNIPPRGRQCVCNTTDTPALCITVARLELRSYCLLVFNEAILFWSVFHPRF